MNVEAKNIFIRDVTEKDHEALRYLHNRYGHGSNSRNVMRAAHDVKELVTKIELLQTEISNLKESCRKKNEEIYDLKHELTSLAQIEEQVELLHKQKKQSLSAIKKNHVVDSPRFHFIQNHGD